MLFHSYCPKLTSICHNSEETTKHGSYLKNRQSKPSSKTLGSFHVVISQSIAMQVRAMVELSTLFTKGSIFTQIRENTEANSTDQRTRMVGVRFWQPMRPFMNGKI